ncbi:hypothetical protein EC991_003461 [Linnemannia zychae]|nr:hypothetical protein EC991_003461 [Linnemannia zychae]
MIPLLCSQCNGCRFRTTAHRTTGPQRSKRKRISSTPHRNNQRRLLTIAATSLILLSLTPSPIHAQPQPYTYKPRYSSGSAIAQNRLYVVSGYTSDLYPSDAVGDTIFVPLDQSFSNDTVPWKAVKFSWNPPKPYSMNGTDAVVVPTADQTHFVLLGSSGQGDPLLMTYDILADSWTPFRSDPAPPRSAVGAALDPQSGTIIVQGGFIRSFGIPLSSEIDILSSKGGLDEWTWTKGAPTTAIKPIFQPIVVYLPTRKATLIIGGTEYVNNTITGFQQFNEGTLIFTATGDNGVTTLSNARVNLTATDTTVIPPRRLSPCYTVLDNGDLFMYGGATFAGSLNDAWILSAVDLTWRSISIGQNPTAGRTGASCQLIAPGQIMVVGGKLILYLPYPASPSYSSSAFSVAGMDSPERGSIPTAWNGYKNKGTKSEVSLPESERLPQTMADMQYGYYVKTLQHHKQYEKRRHDFNRQQPQNGLNRAITSNQYTILKDDYHDGVDLATAVLQLKDVEMGEESIMIPLQTLETGTILVSSHLDDQGFNLQSPTAGQGPVPPMPMRSVPTPLGNNSPPSKAELDEDDEDDDEEVYQPGVGGSITKLNAIKAANAKAKAEAAQRLQQQQRDSGKRVVSPLPEELISEESEILVDNRRGKRS